MCTMVILNISMINDISQDVIERIQHIYIYIYIYIYTVEPLYCGQHWDKYKCPDYWDVPFSG